MKAREHRSRLRRIRPPPLPRRVQLAINRQQSEGERLIGWIQLVIVLILILLHAGEARTAPPNPALPIVLAAFLLVTGTRLWLACRSWLPAWLLTLSAILDILLLMTLVWSVHTQYGQPAAFALKSSASAYLFIFIALRALSFEPRYVLAAGITAIAGWTALVVHAVVAGPAGTVTDDAIAHAYGARVLLAAEADKLMAMALVTILLALGLTRGRRLLVEAVAGHEAARDLARFFSPNSVRHITLAEQPVAPGQGEIRDAAVLQVDLKSFTRVAAALDASRTIRILTEYQGRVVPIIRAHGGQVDKFLGDGIMAVFVDGRPTFARDALEAAIDIAEAMRAWRPEALAGSAAAARCPTSRTVEVSLGVAHGQVVIGVVGAADRLEYTVIGHAVNLAARLERQTRLQPATVIAAASTVGLAVAQGFVAPPGVARVCCAIRGLDDPVPLVVLA